MQGRIVYRSGKLTMRENICERMLDIWILGEDEDVVCTCISSNRAGKVSVDGTSKTIMAEGVASDAAGAEVLGG